MAYYLETIKQFVEELKKSNSLNYKKEVLSKWFNSKVFTELNFIKQNDLQNLLHYVYDYDKQYYVTSINILKHEKDNVYFKQYEQQQIYTLWDLLDDLSSRKYTGYEAIYRCIAFIKNCNEEYKQLILDIIDKDLKVGISETTINKIISNFIKTFDVCLANKYDPKKHRLDDSYVIQQKLDGSRGILIYKNENDIKFYSRQGKEFTTLQKIIDEVKGKLPNDTVLDGEICIVDEKGNEDFQSIMKVIKRKDYTIENPMYKVFDMLTLEEFENKFSIRNYLNRASKLADWFYNNPNLETLSKVEFEVYSENALKEWEKNVSDNNWEGLMFRKNVGYEGKRTNHLLKYKKWNDAEYEVIGIEEGDAQEVIDGVVHKIKCVGSLIIEHKGNEVGVGTGLSLEQRKKWFEHPEDIIGKICTIKFFEETIDQNGKPSLRFPVLKHVYDGKRDL
ncbi:MAG: hypothetical protein NC222_06775 [Staphylococcus sp.]|nr:hypothetical protein [Staphylococcus sp.]